MQPDLSNLMVKWQNKEFVGSIFFIKLIFCTGLYDLESEHMDCSRNQKQIYQSRRLNIDQEQQHFSQNQEKHYSYISQHLCNPEDIAEISEMGKRKLVQSKKFQWDEEFKSEVEIKLLQTNFQSMKVLLHHGNFKLEVSIICTEINEKIFQNEKYKRGSFGVVNFFSLQGIQYAAKGVAFQRGQDGIRTESAYKQYFLFCMADVLGVGPKMFPLFGYDILLTKNMVFFVMEKCIPIRNTQNFQAEMLSNLRTMHSMRLMHLDIKPQNIAFSPKLNKHIFLDFGFSRIIEEPPGVKTKTNFTGTLSYCSEEMRKCCYLSASKYVDLYENDLHCFKKTIEVLGRLIQNQNKGKNEEQFWEKRQVFTENSQISILGQVIKAVRLKYFVETLNIQKILEFLGRKFSCKKFVYQILTNPSTPIVITESKSVQEKLTALKKQIFSQGFCVDRVDLALCQFFEFDNRVKSAEKIIPIFQILHSQSDFFEKFLTKPDFILRLFYFFQPFYKDTSHSIQNLILLKGNIVSKIYNMNHSYNQPVFLSEKVRNTLVYFYQKLRDMKNLKVMTSLHLLFVSVEDWPYVELLQNEIIQIVDLPLMKMLKIAEFLLFKEILEDDLNEENKRKWAKTIQRIQINPEDFYQLKLKHLLNLILTSKTKFINCTLEEKISCINFLQQLSKNCCSADQKQVVYLIKYIFLQICDLPHTAYYQEAPRGLALRIYSKYFFTVKVQVNEAELKEYQFFAPIRFEYNHTFLQDYSESMIAKVRNQIEIYNFRGESIEYMIRKIIQIDFYQRKYVQFFINKIREIFETQPQITVLDARRRLTSIDSCLQFIQKNLSKATENKKITEQQRVCYVNQLEEIFNKFMQSEAAKKVIGESKKIELHTIIIQAKFSFQKGKTSDQMRQKVQDIFVLLQPLPYQSYSMIMNFITLFGYLQNQLHSNQDHYSKGILIKLVEAYINEQQHFFAKKRSILADFIFIKNQAGKQEENVKTIMSVAQTLGKKKQCFNKRTIGASFLCMIVIFSLTLSAEKLVKVYNLIKLNEMELRCWYHAYFVFHIFQMIWGHLSPADQHKQVIRTLLSLKKMFSIYRKLIQSRIHKLFKSLVPQKSPRKFLITTKLQLKAINQDDHRIPLKHLRNTINKIRQKQMARQRRKYQHAYSKQISVGLRNDVEAVVGKLNLRINLMEKSLYMEISSVFINLDVFRYSYRH